MIWAMGVFRSQTPRAFIWLFCQFMIYFGSIIVVHRCRCIVQAGYNDCLHVFHFRRAVRHTLQHILHMINTLSSSIQEYASANNLSSYPFNQKLCRFDYLDFNEIYDSKLLDKIGNIMYEF